MFQFERKRRNHNVLLFVLLAVALGACDAPDPVLSGPRTAPQGLSASTSAGFSEVGSFTMETSPSYFPTLADHQAFIAPRNTGYVIPPNSIAIIRVTGAVTLSFNPAWYAAMKCDYYSPLTPSACQGLDAGSYGPLDPKSNGGVVSIYAGIPASGGVPYPNEWGWRHAMQAEDAPPAWETLVMTGDREYQVWYRPRDFTSASTSSCHECGDIVREYIETGGYHVSVELVHVGSSQEASSEGTATYTVSAPLEVGGVTWMYAADTAALPYHGRISSAYTHVDECTNLTTCAFTPDSAGRMYAIVYMELSSSGANEYVMFDATAGAPRIRLRCEGLVGTQLTANRVTRGNTLDCTAYKDPTTATGDLLITGWWFDSKPRSDGDLTAATWSGPMARSGQVRVRGRIGTGPEHDRTVGITVQARPWPQVRLTDAPDVRTELHPVGMEPYPAPGTPDAPSSFGRFVLNWPDFTALSVIRITEGPNDGDGILASALQMPQTTIFIHPALTPTPSGLSPGMPGYMPWHAWYDDQNGKPSGTCRPKDVAKFKSNVERHEGVTMASNSHWGRTNTAFANANLQGQMERLSTTIQSGEALANLESRVRFEAHVVFNEFMTNTYYPIQSKFDTDDTANVYNIGCALDFNLEDN